MPLATISISTRGRSGFAPFDKDNVPYRILANDAREIKTQAWTDGVADVPLDDAIYMACFAYYGPALSEDEMAIAWWFCKFAIDFGY